MYVVSLKASFSYPLLLEKADIGDFSDSIRQCYRRAWLYMKCFQTYGTIEAINLTSIPIICGTELLESGERGLFWSSFSNFDTPDSLNLTICNTFNKLVLGKNSCIFPIDSTKASRSVHTKITFSESAEKSEEYISGLIQQFKCYQEEFVQGDENKEYLFSERKSKIPEFIKFLENPEEYEIMLRKNGAVIFEIQNEQAFHHEEIMG